MLIKMNPNQVVRAGEGYEDGVGCLVSFNQNVICTHIFI